MDYMHNQIIGQTLTYLSVDSGNPAQIISLMKAYSLASGWRGFLGMSCQLELAGKNGKEAAKCLLKWEEKQEKILPLELEARDALQTLIGGMSPAVKMFYRKAFVGHERMLMTELLAFLPDGELSTIFRGHVGILPDIRKFFHGQ